MHIVVCVKQVPDTETKPIVADNQQTIIPDDIQWVMNPYDEFAVEQAVLLKQSLDDVTITLIRLGRVYSKEALRVGLAMGADQAILIDEDETNSPRVTAEAIHKALQKSGITPDLIFTGERAIDRDTFQVPQHLAQLFSLPMVSSIIEFSLTEKTAEVKREVDGGKKEIYQVTTPALFSCTKGLNTPRYPSLPNVMKAKKKPLTTYTFGELEQEAVKDFSLSNLRLPPEKGAGKQVTADDDGSIASSCIECLAFIKNDVKVL